MKVSYKHENMLATMSMSAFKPQYYKKAAKILEFWELDEEWAHVVR